MISLRGLHYFSNVHYPNLCLSRKKVATCTDYGSLLLDALLYLTRLITMFGCISPRICAASYARVLLRPEIAFTKFCAPSCNFSAKALNTVVSGSPSMKAC